MKLTIGNGRAQRESLKWHILTPPTPPPSLPQPFCRRSRLINCFPTGFPTSIFLYAVLYSPLVLNLLSTVKSHVTELQISKTPIQNPITEEDLKLVGLLAE